VVDDRVFCPWHNLPFELSSGRSPCKALPGLNPQRCEIRGNSVRIEFGEAANGAVDGG
jgi:nitrite reductase/ring-hydroxylating ferredoxin subunit